MSLKARLERTCVHQVRGLRLRWSEEVRVEEIRDMIPSPAEQPDVLLVVSDQPPVVSVDRGDGRLVIAREALCRRQESGDRIGLLDIGPIGQGLRCERWPHIPR